jgi:hypothetical protein
MKFYLLASFLVLLVLGVSGQKEITCLVEPHFPGLGCTFDQVIIGENEEVVVKVEPSDTNLDEIVLVEFWASSIHTFPPQIAQKFRNLEHIYAQKQGIQVISENSFKGFFL